MQAQYGRMKKQEYLALKKAHKLNKKLSVNISNLNNVTETQNSAADNFNVRLCAKNLNLTCVSKDKTCSNNKKGDDSDAEEQA